MQTRDINLEHISSAGNSGKNYLASRRGFASLTSQDRRHGVVTHQRDVAESPRCIAQLQNRRYDVHRPVADWPALMCCRVTGQPVHCAGLNCRSSMIQSPRRALPRSFNLHQATPAAFHPQHVAVPICFALSGPSSMAIDSSMPRYFTGPSRLMWAKYMHLPSPIVIASASRRQPFTSTAHKKGRGQFPSAAPWGPSLSKEQSNLSTRFQVLANLVRVRPISSQKRPSPSPRCPP
jgi:hypothetical protein